MGQRDKHRGFYDKFRVFRKDGRDKPGFKHADCEYFVLDLTHDMFAISAIKAYADACEEEYPQLAADLRRKAAQRENKRLSDPDPVPPKIS